MIGNNTLILNQATINEAVEYWLKNVLLKDEGVEVISVRANSNLDHTFSVELHGLEEI